MPSSIHSFSVHFSNGVPVRSTASLKKPPFWPGVREHDRFLVDVDRPVEVGRDVPLRRLRLLVELDERRAAALVVPREHRVESSRFDRRARSRRRRCCVIERIASRSLISSRPMSSLLVLMTGCSLRLGTRPVEAREDEVVDERAHPRGRRARSAASTDCRGTRGRCATTHSPSRTARSASRKRVERGRERRAAARRAARRPARTRGAAASSSGSSREHERAARRGRAGSSRAGA